MGGGLGDARRKNQRAPKPRVPYAAGAAIVNRRGRRRARHQPRVVFHWRLARNLLKLAAMDGREPVTRNVHLAGLSAATLFAVVTDFPAYPRMFPEIKAANVLSRKPAAGDAGGEIVRVEFRAQVVLAVRYVLDLVCRAQPATAPTVDWSFVEGEIVTDSQGSWRLRPRRDGTLLRIRGSRKVRRPLPWLVLRTEPVG